MVIALLLGLFALLAWISWVAMLGLIALVGILAGIGAVTSRRTAAERRADSICTFARAFDRREVDPWVVRAVYEEYSVPFPVRAADPFDEDMDSDAARTAARAGRSLEQAERNPLFGRVSTIGDLVRFLSHQPRLTSHSSGSRLAMEKARLGAAADAT